VHALAAQGSIPPGSNLLIDGAQKLVCGLVADNLFIAPWVKGSSFQL